MRRALEDRAEGAEPAAAPSESPAGRWRSEIDAAVQTVRRNAEAFGSDYPDDTTRHGRYPLRPAASGFPAGANRGWTTSFVPGMQWLAWDLTGDEGLQRRAREHTRDFLRRLAADEDFETHDIGFLYTLSCVNDWRSTGDEEAGLGAVRAADRLMTRFLEPAGIIQAWGDLSDPAQRGRTIIDSLMNMPLLTFAHRQTGDDRYATAVLRHTTALREQIIRPDGSTFHSYHWDPDTGAAVRGGTAQGAHDDSCWARGQAWGIYGFALNHRAIGDPALLVAAQRCAEYFLAHLPPDRVPYWDLSFDEDDSAPRDSSAGAIAVCGLLELADLVTDAAAAAGYRRAAEDLLLALARTCVPAPSPGPDPLLMHAVYHLPAGIGVDEGCLWGDYFYLEALTRLSLPGWRSPW